MTVFSRLLDTSSRWYYPTHWLVLGILALGIYAQTFAFGFQFDDDQFIVQNPYIKDLSQIDKIWTILPFTRLIGIYSFAFNYSLHGLNPVGYHVFNLIIHLLATGLVWALASLIFTICRDGACPRPQRAPTRGAPTVFQQEIPFLIAVLFLVHPGQTQAVTYISQRFESMATLFYLGAVYTYLLARTSTDTARRLILFSWVVLLAILGILTKEVAVTIPFMLLAVEFLLIKNPFQNLKKSTIYLSVGGGLVLFVLLFSKLVKSGFGFFFAVRPSDSHVGDVMTGATYLLTQMRVFLTFLRLLVFPVNQNVDYDYPLSTGILNPPLTLLGIIVICFFIFFIIRNYRLYPVMAFGLAWILISFSANLAPRANVIFEHKLYLISFGFFLSLGAVLANLERYKKGVLTLLLAVIAVLSVLSFQRNQVWRNEFTLWEDVLQKSPDKLTSFANLAKARGTSEQYYELLDILNKILEKKPDFYTAYDCRASVYDHLGLYDEAIADIKKAITLAPKATFEYYKLSLIYRQQKKYDLSMDALNETIKLNSKYKDAYVDRAMLFVRQQRLQEALTDLNTALSITPNDFQVLINLGGVYFTLGQYPQALENIAKAGKIKPQDVSVYKNIAFCLLKMGKITEAKANLEMALHLDPNDKKVKVLYEDVLKHL